jgi:DNA-binding beta-propeller fold protein YncE
MNMLRYPDVAISPDGDRAYVAHADSELVTVIDLGAGTLETVTPTRSQTLLGRLGSWLGAVFVSEASAKGGAYFRRQVELSPDGRWLYVTGTEAQICTNDQYNPCVENAPSGLRVIDTESMEVIAEHEGIGEIAFTADMRRLLGWAWAFDYRGGGESAEFLSYGPFVIDAETHELVAESTYEMGGPLGAQVVPSTNPLYAFMTLEGPGREEAMTNGGNCLETCVFVAVLEVNGATIVATHEYRGFVSMESLVPMP